MDELRRADVGAAPRPRVVPLLKIAVRRDLGLTGRSVREQEVDHRPRAAPARGADRGWPRYLVGDARTAADVALAALLAPAILPAEYVGPLPSLEEVPDETRRDVEHFRQHPVGRFAARLYHEERA